MLRYAWPSSVTMIDSRRLLQGNSANAAGAIILARKHFISRRTNALSQSGA
jgi:hypothetical protein